MECKGSTTRRHASTSCQLIQERVIAGDRDNPEKNRPISLLDTSYKVVAYILKVRIADAKIRSTIWIQKREVDN